MVTSLRFEHNAEEIVLEAEPVSDGWRVHLPDGAVHFIHIRRLPTSQVQVTELSAPVQPSPDQGEGAGEGHFDQTYRMPFALDDNSTLISYCGQSYRFTLFTGPRGTSKANVTSGMLFAPMAGVLVDLLAVEGEQVTPGQPLAVVEAMKVMTTLEAPFAGRVRKVYVQSAQRVEHGDPVVEIEPGEPTEPGPEHERAKSA